jgi:hypothetical protein
MEVLFEALVEGRGHRQAQHVLEAVGPEARAAVPFLLRMLESWSPEVRRGATLALGRIGPDAEAAVPALQRQLVNPDIRLRHETADALAAIAAVDKLNSASVLGTLADLQGHPRRGAKVTVQVGQPPTAETETDEQGRFLLTLPAGRSFNLQANVDNRAWSLNRTVRVPAGAMAVEFLRIEPRRQWIPGRKAHVVAGGRIEKPEIRCEIQGPTRYSVGDLPDLIVTISNERPSPILLLRAVPCASSPVISLRLLAPAGSFEVSRLPLCGPWRDVQRENLVEVPGGGKMTPFLDTPPALQLPFPRPGSYLFDFHYQTRLDEGQTQRWSDDEEFLERLLQIPKASADCRAWVFVTE